MCYRIVVHLMFSNVLESATNISKFQRHISEISESETWAEHVNANVNVNNLV